MKESAWLKPVLVAQIAFLNGLLTAIYGIPGFLGLREDKKPTDIVREEPENV